ncbi:cell division protein SepF [Ligilactobacillus salitolerans]|uniref:Cell division protein SepF n=1 Tax=Ligilactobacillus salitolerans TaxID=1808352 RepID=A0A401IQZ8_9LACO|nr:cell division protein SepF [Ligilactobacillus salitolerans]GBG93943.1 cell division protein SepF [Ligilactobacillus salitolerans]
MSIGDKINNWFGGYDESENETDYQEQGQDDGAYRPQKSRVMSIRNGKNGEVIPKKIMLFEPGIFSDVKAIASRLLSGEAVVVNFQKMDNQQARRVVDFLSGVTFAIDGEISRIGEAIFLCTPHDFTVEGDITENSRQTDF